MDRPTKVDWWFEDKLLRSHPITEVREYIEALENENETLLREVLAIAGYGV